MNDLVDALQMSKSSVSTASRTLIQIGLVQRISRPGERRDYYQIQEGVWHNLMQARQSQIVQLRQLAERGLQLLDNQPPEKKRRLQEMHDLYAFFEKEMPLLLERWQALRREIS